MHLSALANDKFYLGDIKIIGNTKTSRAVIVNELGFKSEEMVSLKQIKEGVSNLQNTNLFSKVDHHLEVGGSSEDKVLVITVDERWTTIPIFKLSSGGGVSQITLGVYDPNLFGKFVEAGAQYERLGNTNSGVVWFKQPRLFGGRNGINLQVWTINRLRTKYKQDTENPEVKTGFLQSRDKFYLGYDREFSYRIRGHLFYEYNNDTFSDNLLSDEVRAIVSQTGLPPSSQFHFLGAGVDLGRLDYHSYLVDGNLLAASYRYGLSQTKSISDFWQSDFSFQYFKTYFSDLTFAQRILTGFTTTNVLQYWYYLGGLDRVRGFSDNRFAGRYFWLSNTEIRLPVWSRSWFVLQSVGFLDIVSTSEQFNQLDAVDGASAGVGFRVVLPKIYRSVLRFDYAVPLKKKDDMNFSFGVQQFF